MRKYFRKNTIPPVEKKKITTSDVLAFIGVILTFAFGYWGAKLSELSMKQSKEISEQQQQIKGFDSLLKMTKSEISILSKQDNILTSQLLISNNFLNYQNNNIKLSYKTGLAQLMSTENELKVLIWQPLSRSNKLLEWDSTERENFINIAKPLLRKEFTNTFLIQNTKLFTKWVSTYDSLTKYTFNKQFLPITKTDFENVSILYSTQKSKDNKDEINKHWGSCFKSVGSLWQDLNNFLDQYRWGKYNFEK